MCGIVGYVGREERAMDVIIDGLRRLEYRGYDSAGVAIFDDGVIEVRRASSNRVSFKRRASRAGDWSCQAIRRPRGSTIVVIPSRRTR